MTTQIFECIQPIYEYLRWKIMILAQTIFGTEFAVKIKILIAV
jgi:hypothetical protein